MPTTAPPEGQTAGQPRDSAKPDVTLRELRSTPPQVQLLSNSRYHVMLTGAGSGYSRWRDLGVTRWREDSTRDDFGSYFLLRDLDSQAIWSAGYQPSGTEPERYEVRFSEASVRYLRQERGLTSELEVCVPAAADAEARQLSITNTGPKERRIEVTSYAELMLAAPAADAGHPAFLKLFVQTEGPAQGGSILAARRQRSPDEPSIWAAHHTVMTGDTEGAPEFETDRARFLGRCRELRAPAALQPGQSLSNSTGTVLDSIFSLRHRVRIPAGGTVRLVYWTSVASSRDGVLELVARHSSFEAYAKARESAEAYARDARQRLEVDSAAATLFQRMAGHVLYANSALRSSAETIRRGSGPLPGLWAQGISGDVPIVLLQIGAAAQINIVRELLQAHTFWRSKGLATDLVILNGADAVRAQDLQTSIEIVLRDSQSAARAGVEGIRGAVYALQTKTIGEPIQALLASVARIALAADRGTLAQQIDQSQGADTPLQVRTGGSTTASTASPAKSAGSLAGLASIARDLEFFNGTGGFAADGHEYVTVLEGGRPTPAPWINVVTNPHFGFQVAAEGSGFTWSRNSREHTLTPWSNDPVADRPGEVLYLQDQETGQLWSATASPIREPGVTYVARHGQGYSRFEHVAQQIETGLLVYVPVEDPIKIARLKLRNHSSRTRRLTVTAYAEWTLGSLRWASAPSILTDVDSSTGALVARNPLDGTFGTRVAFADLAGKQTAWTADRCEFLGRHGTLDRPAALLGGAQLSGRTGAGLDPCAALQTACVLQPGESAEIVFFLGDAASVEAAQALLARYRRANLDAVFQEVCEHWNKILETVQVRTPDRSMDLILNRWMLYQALACRIWARTAFYQASGAYGFRDQLQDGMALAVTRPDLTREHLLRAAGRQFPEGDLQHWWLLPHGQGVRTRISDDCVWLAYCTHQYLETTGDAAVLDESIPFLEGRTLKPGEHDAFFQPELSKETATLFEHCARALDHSLESGEHGLPLFGTGDWNDGMNRVGQGGRGESVWLGWFLYWALVSFAPLAAARGEHAREAKWLTHARSLRNALEQAWDGDWYRRGYFDDGTPLGSVTSQECKIDSIAQSWAVISGAAEPEHAARAMAQVDAQLVKDTERLVLLFTPPFDRVALDPGYIKGYPPGIRENGGQYTHASTWSVIAQALLGNGDAAGRYFSLLNPINHARSVEDVARYKVEPYVVAADIYSVPPLVGRGGWTWYTGSAGWLYRAGLEWVLGFRVRGCRLQLDPCIPKSWAQFEIRFRHGTAHYDIRVENPRRVNRGVHQIEVDGRPVAPENNTIPLSDDGGRHAVRVILGS